MVMGNGMWNLVNVFCVIVETLIWVRNLVMGFFVKMGNCNSFMGKDLNFIILWVLDHRFPCLGKLWEIITTHFMH